MLNMQSKYGDV